MWFAFLFISTEPRESRNSMSASDAATSASQVADPGLPVKAEPSLDPVVAAEGRAIVARDNVPELVRFIQLHKIAPLPGSSLPGITQNVAWRSAVDALEPFSDDGWTFTHFVAANGAVDVLEWYGSLFLLREASVRLGQAAGDNGFTPLHVAVYNSHRSVCAMLARFGVSTEVEDAYDETPASLARLLGGRDDIAVLLGDDVALKQARERADKEREQLEKEARDLEAERLRAEREKVEAAERAAEVAHRKAERRRRGLEMKSAFETQRLELILLWLQARQVAEREVCTELQGTYRSFLMVCSDLLLHALEMAALPPVVELLPVPVVTDKKKGKGKGRPAATTLPSPASAAAAIVSGGVSTSESSSPPAMAAGLGSSATIVGSSSAVDSVTNLGGGGKKSAADTRKLRRQQEKERQDRARQLQVEAEEKQRHDADEKYRLEDQEAMRRATVERDYLVGCGAVVTMDIFNDSVHPGDYAFHPADCNCRGAFCASHSYSWSCCGVSDVLGRGCEAADDTTLPPWHPGRFQYHVDGCTCWRRAKGDGGDVSDEDDDGGGDADEEAGARGDSMEPIAQRGDPTSATESGGPQEHETPRERRGAVVSNTALSRQQRTCNPGGFVWSCCGGLEANSDGCVMRRRRVSCTSSVLLHDLALRSLDPSLVRTLESRDASANPMVEHVVPQASADVVGRVVLVGDSVQHARVLQPSGVRRHGIALPRQGRGSFGVVFDANDPNLLVGFEVTFVRCAKPVNHFNEKSVVGWLLSEDPAVDFRFAQRHREPDVPNAVSTTIGASAVARRSSAAVRGAAMAAVNSLRDQRQRQRSELDVAKSHDFISGQAGGIGWWSHSTAVRGCRGVVAADANTTFGEGDTVTVIADRLNHHIVFCKNRSVIAATVFVPQLRRMTLLPALTIVPGTAVTVAPAFRRTTLSYYDKQFALVCLDDRNRRIFGSAERYLSWFRNKAEIARIQAGLESGSAGPKKPSGGDSDDDEDFRINFDV